MSITSLDEINAQIQQLEAQHAKLQAEADKQREEAMASIVQELIEKIETYGITAKDLGLSVGKAKRGRKPDWLTQQRAESGGSHHAGGE